MLRVPAVVTATIPFLALAGCAFSNAPGGDAAARPATGTATEAPRSTARAGAAEPVAPSSPEPSAGTSDGRPGPARLTIPALGVRDLRVVPYRGSPDDGPGTRIQDGGVAASPHGPRGGVGPGGVGNYIVTAHRTSSTRAFEDLPLLRVGDRVSVVAGGTRYVYQVTATRSTSFRSARSLARQAAAVPGHPGRRPTEAMITMSTCATPEDHARGNYWADEFGNPEHRIDKIGTLVATRDR
jgi:sortase A